MPELPEVETVRRGLAPALDGARITSLVQRRPDLRFALPEGLDVRLTGARVLGVGRRAKYLTLPLDSGETLIAHLGMTGRFTVQAGQDPVMPGAFETKVPADRHEHIVLEAEGGAAGPVRIGFVDPRRFGFWDLVPSRELATCRHFAGMGPEPLSEGWTGETLAQALEGRRTPIKQALLDQRIVAGLGNIYVCEALHRSGISPRRQAASIGRKRAERLVPIVKAVLAEAIEAGGSTLRDYADARGERGAFQHAFSAYGREGEPCGRCGGVIARIVQSGRSTFYCGGCQR